MTIKLECQDYIFHLWCYFWVWWVVEEYGRFCEANVHLQRSTNINVDLIIDMISKVVHQTSPARSQSSRLSAWPVASSQIRASSVSAAAFSTFSCCRCRFLLLQLTWRCWRTRCCCPRRRWEGSRRASRTRSTSVALWCKSHRRLNSNLACGRMWQKDVVEENQSTILNLNHLQQKNRMRQNITFIQNLMWIWTFGQMN